MKQAVILAGGSGTRLRERLGDLPKPLIDINGVPLLQRQLEALKRYDFNKIEILVSYQAEKIHEFCASKDNWGLNISCIDEGQQLGTAGAVLNIFDRLENEFLVVYGDTMFEIDLNRFQQFHDDNLEVAATLFLHPNDHPHDSDLVELGENKKIVKFHNYPHEKNIYLPNLVNAAMYFVRKEALKPWRHDAEIFDFGKHLFPRMLSNGVNLQGYPSFEYIKDCGTPNRVDRVTHDIRTGKVERAKLSNKQNLIILDRDGTINDEINHLKSIDQFKLISGVEGAIKKLNHAEFRVCVATNQPVVARGECTDDELRKIHNKMETCLGYEGAYIDKIYYCPHHPDAGFDGEVAELKKECECRKPDVGMIFSALKEFNGSVVDSWMIGDSTADILAANRAGLSSILVETGHAGSDAKYSAIPDFVLPNLPAAVDFILGLFPKYCDVFNGVAKTIVAGEVIAIGGQSRSGKSLSAGVLKVLLGKVGIKAIILNTDRWLLSQDLRGNGVLGRHDKTALQELAILLANRVRPIRINLPTYIKKTRTQLETDNFIEIDPNDVVIVEGVMALYMSEMIPSSKKYFINVNERVRKSRLLIEYARRCEGGNSNLIYESRLLDEFPWIEQFKEAAIKVNLEDASDDNQ